MASTRTVVLMLVECSAATPQEMVRSLHQEIVKAIDGRGMREQFGNLGAEPVGGTPEHLMAVVRGAMRKRTKGGTRSRREGRVRLPPRVLPSVW